MKSIKLYLFFVLSFSIIPLLTAQDSAYFRKVVDTLTSEYFEGRGYVNNGINKAADYIAGEFKTYNLASFGENYFQNFKIDVNTFPGKMGLSINNLTLEPGTDFIVDPISPELQGKYEAVTIYKQDLTNTKILKSALEKVKGKVIVIDERNYKSGENKENDKPITEIINILKYNNQIKNVATVILTNEKLTWSPAQLQVKKPVFIVNTKSEIKEIVTITISVDAKLYKSFKTSNVIGYIKGTIVPDSFLVITAHYDHLGRMGSEVYFPGANDNASGVSMMLNLAKYYSKNPQKYSVVFIALSAEEAGLLGAKYFTEHPLFDLSKIRFLVNFDLAGTGDEGIKVVNATVFPNEFKRLTAINDSAKYLSSIQPRGEACISDHCLFYQKKVPCFYMYTLGGIKAYHDVFDKSETLPLTEINDYFKLMVEFFGTF